MLAVGLTLNISGAMTNATAQGSCSGGLSKLNTSCDYQPSIQRRNCHHPLEGALNSIFCMHTAQYSCSDDRLRASCIALSCKACEKGTPGRWKRRTSASLVSGIGRAWRPLKTDPQHLEGISAAGARGWPARCVSPAWMEGRAQSGPGAWPPSSATYSNIWIRMVGFIEALLWLTTTVQDTTYLWHRVLDSA